MKVFFVSLFIVVVVAEPPFYRGFRINVDEDLEEPVVIKEDIGQKEATYPPAGFRPVIEFKLPERRNHEHSIKGFTRQQLPLDYEVPEITFRTQDQIKLPEVEYGFPIIEEIRERKSHAKHPVTKYGPPKEMEEENNKHSSKNEKEHKIESKNESEENKTEKKKSDNKSASNDKKKNDKEEEHKEQNSEEHETHDEQDHKEQEKEGKTENKGTERDNEKERKLNTNDQNHEEKEGKTEKGETSEQKENKTKKSKLTDKEKHNEKEVREKFETKHKKEKIVSKHKEHHTENDEHEERYNNEVYGINPGPYVIVVPAPHYKHHPYSHHIDLSNSGYSTYFHQRSLDALPYYFQQNFQPAHYYLPNNEW